VQNLLAHYLDTTPQRTKLLDAFMAFLVAVGALQFVYCVVAGNYVRSVLSLRTTSMHELTMGWDSRSTRSCRGSRPRWGSSCLQVGFEAM
jgi:hypothetical protein